MCGYRCMFIVGAVCAIGLSDGLAPAVGAVREPPLQIDAVVTEALLRNPEIQAARHRWQAAQERVPQAAALDDPEFKVELFNYPNRLSPDASANTIFGLSQRFPYPGKRGLKASLVVKEAGMAAALLRAKERDVAAQAKNAYYEVFLAHKAIEVHHRQIDLLKEFFEIANARFRAGKGVQVDVLKSTVEISKLSNDLPVLDQQLETAKAKLNLFLSRDPQAPLGEPVEPVGLGGKGARSMLDELYRTAIQNRPELRALDIDIARSQTAIALAQKQYYPDFNVMVSRFQNFDARDGFGGGVTMSLPFSFWTKPKYDAGVREAAANQDSAKATFQALQNQILFEVKDLLARIEAAEKMITLYKTTVLPQSQQTLESARIGYQTGKAEFLTLLDAERAIKDFQLAYYRVLAESEQRIADLERAVGADLNR
ncbi:MAG: TolC family protein [Nitrospiraceae bacterium]|nr:MAG: TolC family protein [Nitrospiraceae bacterium]